MILNRDFSADSWHVGFMLVGIEEYIRSIPPCDGISEVLNLRFKIDSFNGVAVEESIMKAWTENHARPASILRKKLTQEHAHYEQLRWSLIQKKNYNRFYFDERTMNSRKWVVHSEDCVSLIQILHRVDVQVVNVYMRSSEVSCLLYADVIGISDIIWNMAFDLCPTKPMMPMTLCFTVASAHIYVDGDKRRERFDQQRV